MSMACFWRKPERFFDRELSVSTMELFLVRLFEPGYVGVFIVDELRSVEEDFLDVLLVGCSLPKA